MCEEQAPHRPNYAWLVMLGVLLLISMCLMVACGGAPTGSIPLLSNLERAVVQAAIEVGGWFKVREITNAVKECGLEVGRNAVNDIARRWETVGLLTTTQYDSLGRRLGSRITPSLEQAACLGGGLIERTDLSDLPDSSRSKPDLEDNETD